MNRNTVVALSMAAVLGTTGGVAVAIQQNRDQSSPPAASSGTPSPTLTKTPTSSDQPTASPTKSPSSSGQDDSTNEPLLWSNKRQLHDGDRTVELNLEGDVQRVVRMDGGWVVAERTSPQEAAYALWWVTPKSTPSRFAHVVGAWDADATGTHVVGQAESGKVQAWTPATGATRTWDSKQSGATWSGFMGQKVLISMENVADGYGWQMFLWDPETGETTDPGPESNEGGDGVSLGYPHMTVSPGGSYLTGTTFPDGRPDPDTRCLHLESTQLKKASVSWNTCDWRLNGIENAFSPDGTRLLAVPIETDGFGPRTFGVIDASDGPTRMVTQITMPEWTMYAEWADNDHLYVVRATDIDESGYVIDRCDFDGKCSEVAKSKAYPAVGATR